MLTAKLDLYLPPHPTWQGLSPQVRNKLIDDTKKHIRRMLQKSGFIQDQESRLALEDQEATRYLDLVVSGDEER